MKNILVAVDKKDNISKQIEYAAELAGRFQSKIWVVHVAAPDPDFAGYDAGPTSERQYRAEQLRKEHRELHAWAEALQDKGIETEPLLVQGPTIKTILEQIESLDADLLVIGSHQHGILYEAIFGSSTKKLVSKAEVPILVVPLD